MEGCLVSGQDQVAHLKVSSGNLVRADGPGSHWDIGLAEQAIDDFTYWECRVILSSFLFGKQIAQEEALQQKDQIFHAEQRRVLPS